MTPFQRGPLSQTVVIRFFRDVTQGEKPVVSERRLIFAQFHFFAAIVEFFPGLFGLGERVFRLLFVVNVDFSETLAGADESENTSRSF